MPIGSFSPLNHSLGEPITWLLFAFGLILGSFFNVCITRIPTHTFWQSARSRCPHCHSLIPFHLNIPLLSFLWLRGRSRCCQQKISWQYPLVELVTALLMVGLYLKFPFLEGTGLQLQLADSKQALRFFHAALFSSLLLICSVIDIHHQIIPDVISLPMIALTPLVVWLQPELDWQSALLGVLCGGGSVYLIAWGYYLLRKREGIGLGDAKLLAAIGGWLGYQAIFPTFFYGSVLGSLFGVSAMIVTRRVSWQSQIPFGPFLAVGALLHLLMSMRLQEMLLFH